MYIEERLFILKIYIVRIKPVNIFSTSLIYIVNDKDYARGKLLGFLGFLMNCKSFSYECFE